jgi:hypothetical protein
MHKRLSRTCLSMLMMGVTFVQRRHIRDECSGSSWQLCWESHMAHLCMSSTCWLESGSMPVSISMSRLVCLCGTRCT